jgi:hypothetical protein
MLTRQSSDDSTQDKILCTLFRIKCDYCPKLFSEEVLHKFFMCELNLLSKVARPSYCHINSCASSGCCWSYVTSPACYKLFIFWCKFISVFS